MNHSATSRRGERPSLSADLIDLDQERWVALECLLPSASPSGDAALDKGLVKTKGAAEEKLVVLRVGRDVESASRSVMKHLAAVASGSLK